MTISDLKSRIDAAEIRRYFSGGDEQVGLRYYLVRGTVGVFVLRLIATGLGFVTNVLLARFLGPSEYGVYAYIFAWLGLLTVLAMFGFGRLLVREIASYSTSQQWGLIHGLLRFVLTTVILLSIAVAASVGAMTWSFRYRLNPQMFPAFWLALLSLPILALTNLGHDALQGFRRVILGKVPQILIRAPLFIILLLLVHWLGSAEVTAALAIGLGILALLAAFVSISWILYKTVPRQVIDDEPVYLRSHWLRSALPFLVIVGVFEINSRAPVILLGSLAGPEEAGFYAIATLIVSVIGFVLVSANAVLGPIIASLYIADDTDRLQKILTRSARLTFAVAVVLTLLIMVFRNWLLLFFGQTYLEAGATLIVLALGQLFTVAAGSVGVLLVMTGHEKDTLIAVTASVIIIVVLGVLLIPFWADEGAALAAVTGLVVWNMIMIVQAYRRLRIDPTVLGLLK